MNIDLSRRPYLFAVVITLIFVLTCTVGVAWSASGADSATKGWVATDTYRVMNFVVLAVILFILLRKPVSQVLKNRITGIQDQLHDLEIRKKEAEKLLAEYEERLMQLDQEAEKIVAEYVRQGEEARGRIIQEAKTAAHKVEEQARRNIDHEFEIAKVKLKGEILEKALIKAEEKIKNRITPDDQKKLVDEYIEKVVV
ncbi:MAG: ATP synthase F0 subunit B [Desulfobacterales bacterium]|nr:ATP synthase F0 subunit B [Desulfobacterales bacterium]